MVDDLIERGRNRRQRSQALDQPVAPFDGFAGFDGIAVRVRDGPRGQVALAVRERLVELHREAVFEVGQDVFAGRHVHAHVIPFLGRDVGQPAFLQSLAGRDDLDDGAIAGLQVALDAGDQRWRLHRRDEVIEEPLLGRLEGAARRGLGLGVEGAGRAGDVGGLHRRVQIVVNDLEGARIGVVDADLRRGQRMFEHLVFHAVEGQRARRIKAERLQVARQHLHRRDPAVLDRRDELAARGEREILAAPQSEPLGVGEILHGGRAGGGNIDDASIGQRVLEPKSGAALLRRRLLAALAGAAGRVRHRVRFVEHDHTVEVGAEPIDDLLHAARLLAALL